MSLSENLDVIFKCILDGRLCHDMDDTLLQKLLSRLENKSGNSAENLQVQKTLKESNVLDYITTSLSNGTLPVAVSFAFQLLTVLIKENILDIFCQEPLLAAFLRRVETSDQEGSLVRVAILNCLLALAQKEQGYLWIQSNRLVDFGWNNLNKSSIFVQRSSENFLASMLIRCLESGKDDCGLVVKASHILKAGASQDVFVGCVRFLATAFSVVLPLDGHSLNEDLVQAFLQFPNEDETADKLNKLVALSIEGNDLAMKLGELCHKKRFVSYLKLATNFVTSRTAVGSDNGQCYILMVTGPLYTLTPTTKNEFSRAMENNRSLRNKLIATSLSCLSKLIPHMNQQTRQTIMDLSLTLNQSCNNPKMLLAFMAFNKDLLLGGVTANNESLEVFLNVCTQVLQDVAVSPSSFQSCCGVVRVLLPLLLVNNHHSHSAESLGECLNRRLLDRKWEVVDSILELLASLSSPHVSEAVFEWTMRHELHLHAWDMLANREAEGYVRAACIQAVVALAGRPSCWQHIKEAKALTHESFVNLLCQLLRQDPEAFVQRAAVNGILTLMETQFLSPERDGQVGQVLLWAVTSCLDWEVKMAALNAWNKVLASRMEVVPGDELESLTEMCKTLFECGCLTALACSLTDCDRPVKLLAAQTVASLLKDISHFKCAQELRNIICQYKGAELLAPGFGNRDCALNVMEGEREQVLDMVVDIDMYDRITAVINPISRREDSCVLPGFACYEECMALLWNSDLQEMIKENSHSTDVYEDNFSALLDDILAAVDSTDHDQEYQAIDCY